jgi:predicted phosphodiesterase
MRYGIITDIHGNLEALQEVLKECRAKRVQTLLCAGDIVGYGASPKECVALIRQWKAVVVAGNHDWAVSGRLDFSHFTEDGKAAIEWTRSFVSLEDIAFLNSLELSVKNKDAILAHASLHQPGQFMYMTNVAKIIPSFALMDVPVCFIGHTHVPGIYVESDQKFYDLKDSTIEIDLKNKYIVNAGSVGQPRDGNPMASFCLYDTELKMIELRRVPYDIASAQQKIIKAGLPHSLALRLAKGE